MRPLGTHTAIIGGRRNSKRLPGKNKMLLGRSPLINYTIEAALAAKLFDNVILTSDDEDICRIGLSYEKLIVDRRPANLADDKTSMLDVQEYLIRKYPDQFPARSNICVLSPCTPFRRTYHIRSSYELFIASKAESLVTVVEFLFPPALSLEVSNGWVKRGWTGLARKAEHPRRYYPSGAILWTTPESFAAHKDIYTPMTIAYKMAWPDCLDIDTREDFELAEKLLPLIYGKK